ncbi:tyrosine-type recombinase/integrase [Haloarcula sp. CGMCC 1.6347]|uniref:tyrosine-type recombinase/integrase n=1 Tax=Haloarcula sp. CGMCC 1.6347 TaxID=3111455 RepID=UPI00300F20E3
MSEEITEAIDYEAEDWTLGKSHKRWVQSVTGERANMDKVTTVPNLFRAWCAGEGLVIDDTRDPSDWEYPAKADYGIPIEYPNDVTKYHLKGWYKALKSTGWAGSTIISYHGGVMYQWFVWMEDRGIIDDILVDEIDVTTIDGIKRGKSRLAEYFREQRGVIHATYEEYQKLRANVAEPKTQNELVIALMYTTGVREKELRNIKKSDFDDEVDNCIWVSTAKNGDLRPVYYDPDLQPLLDYWLDVERSAIYGSEKSDYIFPTNMNEKMARNTPNNIVTEAAERAGIQEYGPEDAAGRPRRRITSHALRRGFAVRCVKNGMDIRTLQRLLGHRQIEQTKVYLRFSDKDVRKGYNQYAPHRTSE